VHSFAPQPLSLNVLSQESASIADLGMETAMKLTRRSALTSLAVTTAAASSAHAESKPFDLAFKHGVASGDPTAAAVIIWTRVSTNSSGAVPVEWMVATDKEMKKVVRAGSAMAFPSRDHTVKADATGLKAGTTYFYAFKANGVMSPVGKTKTAPVGKVAGLKVALVSCSNYPAGYFNAYKAIADRSDVDLVIHVGDYIYEYGAGGYATDFGAKAGRVPDPPTEIVSLSDYRRRYAQYRSDPDLQAAHAAAPWVVTWDDHEVTNDSWQQGAENHDPDKGEGPYPERERVAMQAYYEWMPIRDPIPGKPFESINRTFQFGDLVTVVMLETRLQARAQQLDYEKDLTFIPLDVSVSPPTPITDPARLATIDPRKPPAGVVMAPNVRAFGAKLADPARQLLGANQEAWVGENLKKSVEAGTLWQLIGNQIIMARVKAPDLTKTLPPAVQEKIASVYPPIKDFIALSQFGVPYNLDAWDGYPAARERFYAMAKAAKANLVVVTGDTHSNWANELSDSKGGRVGVEFGGTSVTSPGIGDLFAPAGLSGDDFGRMFAEANDDVVWHDEGSRGFVLVSFTRDTVEASYQRVDTIYSKEFGVAERARFRAKRSPDGVSALEKLA